MWKNILFVCLFITAFPVLACAGYYQYKDKSGRPLFTDDISRVPREYREDAKWVTSRDAFGFLEDEPETPERPEEPAAVDEDIPEHQRAALEQEGAALGFEKKKVEETFNGLRRLHQSLMDKREVLDVNNVEALDLFNAEVLAYNKAMDDYDKALDAFNQKVLDYNKRATEFDARQKASAASKKEGNTNSDDSFWGSDTEDSVSDNQEESTSSGSVFFLNEASPSSTDAPASK
ncbi:hypothetical protein LJC24_01840 [Desulfococcaceae bacterium OttesenSCG-928-F15]|nr:hypothetical protein [Desulfococcaceae bacterium OttesenSCG-928-F15]